MKIDSLLNPEVDNRLRRRSSQAPRRLTTYSDDSSDYAPEPPTIKKIKVKPAKDAAKFEEGPTHGMVRYPPFEVSDDEVIGKMARLIVEPHPNHIFRMPRRIPYASGKKEFQQKTGRDGFEVFQYDIKVKKCDRPDQRWTIMWDYNNGLVKITPFFKCMPGCKKTDPKNAILASPGLMEMCHSITGGALAAQGYWLPYEAARELASTFCYNIRYALIPLFGPDFVNICTHPSDPIFKRWTIHESTISSCEAQVRSWTQDAAVSLPASRLTTSKSVSRLNHSYRGAEQTIDLTTTSRMEAITHFGRARSTVSPTPAIDPSNIGAEDDDEGYITPPTTAHDTDTRETSFEPGWTVANPPTPVSGHLLATSMQRRGGATPSPLILPGSLMAVPRKDSIEERRAATIAGRKRALETVLEGGSDGVDEVVEDEEQTRMNKRERRSEEWHAAHALIRLSRGLPGDGVGW